MRKGDWRHEAACLGEDPELFFPIGSTGPAALQIEEATGVCRRCEVTEECLRWATDQRIRDGVWGGLAEDERAALKRRDLRQSRGEPRPFVDAEPTREKVQQAMADGWTATGIKTVTGVGHDQILNIHRGRVARITQATAEKIAAADLSQAALIVRTDPIKFHMGAML